MYFSLFGFRADKELSPLIFKARESKAIFSAWILPRSSMISGAFAPLIDKSANFVYNIDGQPLGYSEGQAIKQGLQNINLLFAIESGSKQAEQFPVLLNAIQNLRLLFEAGDDGFRYRFGAAVSLGGKVVTVPLTSGYQSLTDVLNGIAAAMKESGDDPLPAWSALKKALDLLDGQEQATSLIVSVGETGALHGEAMAPVITALKKKNCRLLGWQLYTTNSDNFNNFVLQLNDMIDAYATSRVTDKRGMILYADQFCSRNLLRDAGNNFFLLDYPGGSMTQGGFLFPEKGETLRTELFAGAVDTLLSQIRADNRLLSGSIDRAFAPSAMTGTGSTLFLSPLSVCHGEPCPAKTSKRYLPRIFLPGTGNRGGFPFPAASCNTSYCSRNPNWNS